MSQYILTRGKEGTIHLVELNPQEHGLYISMDGQKSVVVDKSGEKQDLQVLDLTAGSIAIINDKTNTVCVVKKPKNTDTPVPTWYIPVGMAFVYTMTWAVQKVFGII